MAEKRFNVGIKAIIREGDKVLIVKNSKGFWEVPGGRIDANESIEQTLARELKEELPNLKSFKKGRLLAASRLQKDIKPNLSLFLIFFEVSATFKGQPMLSKEHQGWQWANKQEALDIINVTCKEAIKNVFN